MQSFDQYLNRKKLEPIMLDIASAMTFLELDPQEFLLYWSTEHCPEWTSPLIESFERQTLVERELGPFPGKGGWAQNLKNWFQSLGQGIQRGFRGHCFEKL